MNYPSQQRNRAARVLPIVALCLASLSAQAQIPDPAASPKPMAKASMPSGTMDMGDMKQSMRMGMDKMQAMSMSGDMDKDFAMMMKMHHQQGVEMAEMQLKNGKSAEMKTMARNIVTAQNKEIAQFDKWLTKHK